MPVKMFSPGCPCCCCYGLKPTASSVSTSTTFSATVAGHSDAAKNGTYTLEFYSRTLNATTGCYDYFFRPNGNSGLVLYLPSNGSDGTWCSIGQTTWADEEVWGLVEGSWVNQWQTGCTLTIADVTYTSRDACKYCYASTYQTAIFNSFGITASATPWADSYRVTFTAGGPGAPGDICYWPAGDVTLTPCGRASAYVLGGDPDNGIWSTIPGVAQVGWDRANFLPTEVCETGRQGDVSNLTTTIPDKYCPCPAFMFCGTITDGAVDYKIRLIMSPCNDLYIDDDETGDICVGTDGSKRGPYQFVLYGQSVGGDFRTWFPSGGGWTRLTTTTHAACAAHPTVSAFVKV